MSQIWKAFLGEGGIVLDESERRSERSPVEHPAVAQTVSSPGLEPRRRAVRSHPVTFDGCFGWFHERAGDRGGQTAATDVAVLLCPALGWDGLHAYHGTRLLADALGESGVRTLRFQYPGTGDSRDLTPGPDGTVEHWAAWLEATHSAAEWLRATTGARRLVLAGLRFGALVAATVAGERDDVDGLMLLAPVLRGKSYLRQLDMEARLESNATPDAAGGLEFHELRFGAATVARIGGLDLRQCRLPPRVQAAVFTQAPSQLAESCMQEWRDAGVTVHAAGFEGLEPLLQEAIHRDPPPPDFSRLIAWVTQAVSPRMDAVPASAPPPEPMLDLPGCTETPLRFGTAVRLFGILCRPKTVRDERVVLIGNTGRDPHYGIARFGTELARRLADEGVASFRMDFAGLGDSSGPPAAPDTLSSLFETDRSADVSAAIDALEAAGFRRFAIQGVCSGAYHAYRAAQSDSRIESLLMVNLPTFEWHGGDTVRSALWKAAPPSRLLAKLTDTSVLARAARGQVNVRGVLSAMVQRALAVVRPAQGGRDEAQATPQRAMAALSQRGLGNLFLYSAGDPGLDALCQEFGAGGQRLCALPGVDLRIVPGIDHVLSGRQMREKAAHEIVSFLAPNGSSLCEAERAA